MMQTEVTTNTLHNNGAINNNVAKTDKQADIVKRLEELNKWQEEQKKLLEARQTMQRQMLGMEQRTMYQMLGLQTDDCDLSKKDDIASKAVSQENMTEKDMIEMEEYYEDSTENSLTMSQLDDEDKYKEAQKNDAEPYSLKTFTSGLGTVEYLDTAKETKPKKPFLKRGEGLKQRFKIDPDQLRINNLPRYKYANAHPRLRLKPSSKCMKYRDSQTKASKKTEIVLPAAILDAQEQRFQNLLISSKNTCSSTPENKSIGFSSRVHIADTKPKETEKVQEFPPNEGSPTAAEKVTSTMAWSKILDPQQIEPMQVPRQHSHLVPQSEESIFELLEQKASNDSFDMNSTCLRHFMQRRLSEKLNETDNKIPVQEHLKTRRIEPVIVNKPSSSSLEDEQSQFTEESLSTESDDTTHKTVETAETSYGQKNSAKMRVRFSNSNETHEYEEESDIALEEDTTRLTAGSLVDQEGQDDTSNQEFFEQFKQALFATLQLKADEHNNDTTQNSKSDTTLTPKDSIIDNNKYIYPPDLQEKTDTIKLRLAELEKEISNFKEYNLLLMKAKQEHELEKSLHAQEHLEAMEHLKDEKIRMEIYLHDERVKLEEEKRQFEQQLKMKNQGLLAKERKECERLRDQVSQFEIQLKTKESNHTTAQARLRTQIRNMEREQNKLHEQIEQLTRENKRLESENLRISREQNNKILLEINRNIAKLAPKQIQNSSASIPEEGPPTLGAHRTISKCIVAAATANKISGRTHKAVNTDQPPENSNSFNLAYGQQCYQQNIYKKKDGDDDIKELQSISPKTNHKPPMTQTDAPKSPTNDKSPLKRQTQIPTSLPSSPRMKSGASNCNMKREIINADGSKDIWYPNGNLKKISHDGMIIRMLYYNKDIKETNINEGTVKYYYAETNTWHTTYLDGLEILEFPNGQIEHRHKNGIIEVHYPNNSVKIMNPKDENKQEEWRFADGTHLVQMRNGDKILSLPNGQKEIHNKMHKRREYPDGTVKIVYPDGSTETRYSNGRVRLKDKDGKLVMDTGLVA